MRQLQKKESVIKEGFQDCLPEIPPGNPPKEYLPVKEPLQKKPPNEAPPRRDPPKEKPPLKDPPVKELPVKEPLFLSRKRDRPSGQGGLGNKKYIDLPINILDSPHFHLFKIILTYIHKRQNGYSMSV